MLMFALELERQARANAWKLTSLAAQPGSAATNLQTTGPNHGKANPARRSMLMRVHLPFMSHSAADGALPSLRAATVPDARGGEYGAVAV